MAAGLRRVLGSRRSLRSRIGRVVALGGLLLVAQVISQLMAGLGAHNAGAAAARMDDVRTQAIRMAAAVEDQRSAVLLARIDGVTAARSAYTSAGAESAGLERSIARALAGTREARLVSSETAALAAWQAWAAAQLAAESPPSDAELRRGESLYANFQTVQRTLADELAVDTSSVGNTAENVGLVAFISSMVGSLGVGAVLVVLVLRLVQLGVRPIIRLAGTAGRIARGEPATIDVAATDEVEELALALRAWQAAAAERAVVAEQAPTGIVRLDLEGRITSVNRAFALMHAMAEPDLVGRPLFEIVQPADLPQSLRLMREVQDGVVPSGRLEARNARADGSVVWASVTVGRVLSADGGPAGTIGVVEDITEPKLQAERAALIQRELWPSEPPVLEGYQVAGGCLPAQQVAGDLYDWTVTPDGHLELTVADVMGKGIGAALVMAMLRAALRAAPPSLGPAAKLHLAARSMTLGRSADGTFVTVFHARLDPATGVLRYADAGHGYCEVVSADGRRTPLGTRSLPLGVLTGETFQEGSVRLEPGDTLVAYSDGLVEGPDAVPEGVVAEEAGGGESAADVVHRLLGRMPLRLADDVTAMVLRRLAAIPEPVVAGAWSRA